MNKVNSVFLCVERLYFVPLIYRTLSGRIADAPVAGQWMFLLRKTAC